ncbi:MAG: hypothetical protein IJD06_09235 [Clostridia bacterium]|nr:hypothetical protein [Clostridia bacterium]
MNQALDFFRPSQRETALQILEKNGLIAAKGLAITPADAAAIAETHAVSLRDNRLVELGCGSVEKIIELFADSPYADRSNFASIVSTMTEAFGYLKRETEREIPDNVLLSFMRVLFDQISHGSEELFLDRDMPRIVDFLREKRSADALLRWIAEENTLEFMQSPTAGDRGRILQEYFGAGDETEPEIWEEEDDDRSDFL